MLNQPGVLLAKSILLRAIGDLLTLTAKEGTASNPSENDKIDALKFLTDYSGPWAKSRHDVCLTAGVCEERLRERVLDFLNDEDDGALMDATGESRFKEKAATQSKAIYFDMIAREQSVRRTHREQAAARRATKEAQGRKREALEAQEQPLEVRMKRAWGGKDNREFNMDEQRRRSELLLLEIEGMHAA